MDGSSAVAERPYVAPEKRRRILGINFFAGSAGEAVDLMLRNRGLLVVPSGPGMRDLPHRGDYREALLDADLAIMDSALMVMVWNVMKRDSVKRVSGLEYLDRLLKEPAFCKSTNTLWIMASEVSRQRNLEWLACRGVEVDADHVVIAPVYKGEIVDPELIKRISTLRPEHIVITIGGGTQEQLGRYIKTNLDYKPGIHCIGAAIAFLSGDQVRIPMWADRFYLGWFCRCVSRPARYVPRYWAARGLVGLLLRYGSELPAKIR
jgi:UDP-N-acetyl-D-mannosaminuronic acid transferase (WecB/TagA/CpsF family)